VRLLLDSHVFLWSVDQSQRLSTTARREIERPSNDVYVSAASVWELAIKMSKGRLRTRRIVRPQELEESALRTGFIELPVTSRHAAAVATLGLLHGDPFDRLLIAQAQIENLTILTVDPRFAEYPVQTMAAD
jgi:PIN domain nuclease of toxin-antitoxin system